ncbi:transcription termination factor 5, mitochondrial-like [Ostrinia furnacalis]|uniref:transcription termination factor 5, mitochondrial-like n=1 Tax=Ostrinia furnacalis TaxID=93504 RepID=UPI00103C8CB3|nr:transcription termination factor 5, mitochondrial-like [Ostrinia furnacalis]
MISMCYTMFMRAVFRSKIPRIIRLHYSTENLTSKKLSDLFNISENSAQFICLKHPVINKLDNERLGSLLTTMDELGFHKKLLIEEPLLFSILPITLKYRYKVLEECGIEKVNVDHILSYLPIMKKKTIGDLKASGMLLDFVKVENRLASYMTQWPTSLTTLIYGDIDKNTLYSLRLKIIQRYLELVLDLSKEEFYRGIKTYPTIKHRPLQTINETLNILQSEIMIPNHKIKTNLYLVHADPDNLRKIVHKFRTIGGIDVKEVIRLHPKLATKSYSTLSEIRKILNEYGISNEAQMRCFDIYTLGPDTVRERLEKAKKIPEFKTFFNHPRFLKMIHYKNTALKRLTNLYGNNKKCLSLNILSGSSAHFESFEKAPGDRLGKGKDLVFCISQCLKGKYSSNEIRKSLKRHPFWINIPLVQVNTVYEKLSKSFSSRDIYENCPILLYPWNKIREALNLYNNKNSQQKLLIPECVDLTKLSKSQKLSLVLYLLEKNHYFTGNGVWSEEKKALIDPSDAKSYLIEMNNKNNVEKL